MSSESNNAAPGIDLEQFRDMKDKCQRIQENRDFWHGVAEKLREELFEAREELAMKIKASRIGNTEGCIDSAVSAFDDVFDGVSHKLHNKRKAIAAALAAAMQATSAEVGQ